MDHPDWLDRREYPFESRFLDLEAGRLHYVDEGAGEPILYVHGTPDWSFQYRSQIRELAAAGYRCVAPDHLGFGLSDKPARWGYRPQDHARNLRRLIDHLGLERFTLVVHDFGGPIGLGCALDRPEQVDRLVVMNTFLWSLRANRSEALPLAVMGSPVGGFLYRRLNFSPRVILPAAWGDHRPLTPAIHRHYLAPAPRPADRNGMWAIARAGLGESAWYDSLTPRLDRLRDTPALLVWGLRDPAFGPRYLDRWRTLLPAARVVTFPRAGHFVPDEAGPDVSSAIRAFLADTPITRAVGAGDGTAGDGARPGG